MKPYLTRERDPGWLWLLSVVDGEVVLSFFLCHTTEILLISVASWLQDSCHASSHRIILHLGRMEWKRNRDYLRKEKYSPNPKIFPHCPDGSTQPLPLPGISQRYKHCHREHQIQRGV
jgi:hypothetical protein